ncbi:MAG: ABC-F family ATP-binding cassette domain-containing protein [Desulfobacula sp.]|nr:ABC-F family ATP-binding cassette domain-containing protein [Desulfobacula sp.]
MLNIESIYKGFGDQILLEDTGLQINQGERVGLVGRNGHGKTTLLNMMAGIDHPDDGKISCPTGYRIGILSQKISFEKNTIIEEAMQGLLEHERDHSWKAEKILAGLGFSQPDMKKDPVLFSGGFQVRLNLAKVLVSEPDLLILDEPTNYLDITSIRWISQFLVAWPREVLLVTHDRGFMDNVVTHIAGIHRQKIKKIKGDTFKYYFQVAQDEEIYEKTRQNEEKRKKEIELFVTRFRAKARLANMVQSRLKTLEKTQSKEKLAQLKNLAFSFNCLPFAGKQMMAAENLSFSWDPNTPLIQDFSLTIYPNDRIAIIGKNGKGKTTLLRLLTQNLDPKTGTVVVNPGVSKGYFEQTNIQSLNDNFTIEEELTHSQPDYDRQAARNICGAMMFEKDAALKKISVLSGGEKSRVMLGKLLISPLNLVLLDEPTNHLDIEACDAFVEALNAFEGAVILVTHNELFLHALANRLVVFKKEGISLFEGTYQEFLDKEGWEDEEGLLSPEAPKPKTDSLSKKELRQKKSEIIASRSKVINPIQRAITRTEDTIEEKEGRIQTVNEQLLIASQQQDGPGIATLAKELAGLEKEIEALFEDLELQTDEMELKTKYFEKELNALEGC